MFVTNVYMDFEFFWHSHVQFIGLAVLMPLQGSLAYPSSVASGYSPWDETSMMINASSSQMVPSSQDDFTSLHGIEGMDTLLSVLASLWYNSGS